MKPARPRILTINGGSSRIKYAVLEGDEPLQQTLHGGVERIGLPGATLGPGAHPEVVSEKLNQQCFAKRS